MNIHGVEKIVRQGWNGIDVTMESRLATVPRSSRYMDSTFGSENGLLGVIE